MKTGSSEPLRAPLAAAAPSAKSAQNGNPALPKHSLWEDAQAIVTGTLLVSLGVTLLGSAKLITGGTVGLAFLLHYMTGTPFGLLFFAINIPFYFMAVKKMGWVFTLKTFASVCLLSGFSAVLPLAFRLETINPLYAAAMGGLLAGVGLLILFRHKASLGGINVLVLYLQERYGVRAGLVQLALDGSILLASIPMISLQAVIVSLLGAAVMNMTLAINHRPGRYVAI